MEAIAREFPRRDIVPDLTSLYGLSQKVSDQPFEMPLRSRDVLALMQQCREFSAVVLVGNERVRLEYGFEPLTDSATLVANPSEILQVAGDLTLVPGNQNRFDA